MSATEIINELPKLTDAERRAVLNKLRELAQQDKDIRTFDEAQAADLRARLKTFAEDWERPEAAIYDEDPTR